MRFFRQKRHSPLVFLPKKSASFIFLIQLCTSRESVIYHQKVLTDSLRSMENDGLIIRTVYPEVPPRVEYSLSELGLTLKPILDSMVEWGNAYKKM